MESERAREPLHTHLSEATRIPEATHTPPGARLHRCLLSRWAWHLPGCFCHSITGPSPTPDLSLKLTALWGVALESGGWNEWVTVGCICIHSQGCPRGHWREPLGRTTQAVL